MSATAEVTRNTMNDPNLFRTQYKPMDSGSPEHKTVQQIRQKCDELLRFIDNNVIKGQHGLEVEVIKQKLIEASFWCNHFATRDQRAQVNSAQGTHDENTQRTEQNVQRGQADLQRDQKTKGETKTDPNVSRR